MNLLVCAICSDPVILAGDAYVHERLCCLEDGHIAGGCRPYDHEPSPYRILTDEQAERVVRLGAGG